MTLFINGRYRGQSLAGIQRVAHELERRLTVDHVVLECPSKGGAAGHAWEQFVLPAQAGGQLIWGPCNSGPLISPHQVLTMHGAGIFDHPEWFSPAFVQFHTRLWRMLARRVRRIVTVSSFSRDRLSEVLDISQDRIDIVPNGVDARFRPADASAIAAARSAVGLGADQPYFATLSTIEPRKNLPLVIHAFSHAKLQLPRNTALLVIGARGSTTVFRADGPIPESEGVIMAGRVPDELIAPLLSGALAVLYPSLYEGFGLPVLEAMACGTTAVTTRLASLPEVGGDAALYVDPTDPHDLAQTLIDLAGSQDLRERQSVLGLARARLFSWDDSAAQMDEILRRHA